MTKKRITAEVLKEWNACKDVFDYFNELFPEGADLQTASEGLIESGNPWGAEWSNWLWWMCSNDERFCAQTVISAGAGGTASAGDGGTAIAGDGGTAKAGDGGAIIILFYDGEKHRCRCAEVGGPNGLKPNTFYKLDKDGNFVEAEATHD